MAKIILSAAVGAYLGLWASSAWAADSIDWPDMCARYGVPAAKAHECAKRAEACLERIAARLKPDENGDINITQGTIGTCVYRARLGPQFGAELDMPPART